MNKEGKLIGTESRLVVVVGWWLGGVWEVTGRRFLFGVMKMFWNQIVVILAKL